MRPIPFADLTPEQQSVVRRPIDRHVATIGAPGSGKTLVLVQRAVRLVELEGIDPNRILLVTYTNALEAYIRSGLNAWGLPTNMVTSFDALMRELHQSITGRTYKAPPKASDDERFNGQRDEVHALLNAEVRFFGTRPRWDVVLADEAQDLSAQDVETLAMLGRHVTVAMDSRQQLYRRGSDTHEILGALGLRWESAELLSTFRCSQSVLRVAACAATTEEDRRFLPDKIGRSVEEIPCLRVLARDRDEEDRFLHDALRARSAAGRSCAVLLPTRYYAGGIAKSLASAGFSVEGPKSFDLSSGAIKVMTYHSAKGLSFDSVFMPRLWETELRKVAKHTKRGSLLFVGLTRATTYLFLSSVAGKEAHEWADFDQVDPAHLHTIVPSEVETGSTVAPISPPTVEDLVDDFF